MRRRLSRWIVRHAPGVIFAVAMLLCGLALAFALTRTSNARAGAVITQTIHLPGATITKNRTVSLPARTIRRHGKTIRLPAETFDLTSTQVVPGPVTTVNGTVTRVFTISRTATVTGPTQTVPTTLTVPTTITTTQTVPGPTTTVVTTVTIPTTITTTVTTT